MRVRSGSDSGDHYDSGTLVAPASCAGQGTPHAGGLVGRWEISREGAPAARGHGLGRDTTTPVWVLVPADEPVFAQPGPAMPAS